MLELATLFGRLERVKVMRQSGDFWCGKGVEGRTLWLKLSTSLSQILKE